MEPPPRRQNRSCDQCRASKRRCVQIEDTVDRGSRCRTCARLDRRCTFNFAHHHRVPKQRQTFVIPDFDPLAPHFASVPLFDDCTTQGAMRFTNSTDLEVPDGVDATLASSIITTPCYGTSAFDFTDCISIPNDPLDGPWEMSSIISLDTDCTVVQDTIEPESSLQSTSVVPSLRSTLASRNAIRAKAMHNSPLSLLNSTMNIRLENEYLTLIFHSLTVALYVRYLSPPSKVFTTESPCEISFEQSERHLLHATPGPGSKFLQVISGLQYTSPDSQHVGDTSHDTACIEPPTLQSHSENTNVIDLRVRKVTMFGVAMFLDHFGPIYGSYRSKLDRQEDEAALSATVRAFVLANAPNVRTATERSQDTDTIFMNAWLDAYHHLSRSMARRSFTLAYTAFTFDLLPIPLSLSSDSQYVESKERLLRHFVQQLQGLLSTVGSFCGRMSEHSKYRSVLEACKEMMEWHGYVRDTISAFINRSQCIMAETLRTPLDQSADCLRTPADETLLIEEETLRRKCQQMSCRLFVLYRDIVELRACLDEAATGYTTISERHQHGISRIMASLDSIQDSWVDRSIDQFAQMSPASQVSFGMVSKHTLVLHFNSLTYTGFLVIYWNLGVLKLYEMLQPTTSSISSRLSGLRHLASECRNRAITLHSRIVRSITNDGCATGLPVLEDTSFKLPFMAHHANTTLLALALTTAIEHTIEMFLAGELEADTEWLNPSLWCLLSLEHSASGRSSVRPSLDSLIQRYGDIILECWSGGEEML